MKCCSENKKGRSNLQDVAVNGRMPLNWFLEKSCVKVLTLRDFYRVLVGRPEGKRPLGRPRRRWENTIKLHLREIGIDGLNWMRLTQDRVQWRAFLNTVMNLRVP
jgi:hypothetical protein